MHTLFLVVGETSSGKDSIVSSACESLGLRQLRSYATRPRRTGEADTHVFIDKTEVPKYKSDIVAYTKIGEYEYFSTVNQLYESDFYVIDPNGVIYLREMIEELKIEDIRFVVIYINTPYDIRAQRALEIRKDNSLTYYKRVKAESEQFELFKQNTDFDYAVHNVDFDKACKVFNSIINIEKK